MSRPDVSLVVPARDEAGNIGPLVDEIRAVKSEEELKLMRETARLQDEQMQAAFAAVKPGMTDQAVKAAALHYGTVRGSEQG